LCRAVRAASSVARVLLDAGEVVRALVVGSMVMGRRVKVSGDSIVGVELYFILGVWLGLW
jgi:hypothetical protein